MIVKKNEIPESFPTWSPKKLILLISPCSKENYPDGSMVKGQELLITLCNNQGMEKVWLELYDFFDLVNDEDDYQSGFFIREFAEEISWAENGLQSWNALTKKEIKEKRNSLTKQINDLARELERYKICPTFDLIDPAVLRHLRLTDKDYEYIPPVSALLRNLADIVPTVELPIIQTSPNRKDAKLNFFIKVMANFMREHINDERDIPYQLLIDLCAVFFPEYAGELDIKSIKEKANKRKAAKSQTQK